MGECCSKIGEELPAATEEDLVRLKEKGHMPCVAVPTVDLKGDNHLQTVYVAEYENGTELTFLFLDEDRPNPCMDCVYDTIRRPLFGRYSDIETIFIINDTVEFPGTYSGEQTWSTAYPEHGEATVELSKFEKKDGDPVIWVNTWNHLLGEKNNNTDTKEITYCIAKASGSTDSTDTGNFVVRKGCRKEVDARFKGVMTSVSAVMTPDRERTLANRSA